MVTKTDQFNDFPLPSNFTQNPTRADFPRQLVIYNGNWVTSADESILAGMDYLAVSYRQSDFPDKEALEIIVRRICFKKGIEAYWLDFACTGETPEEKNEDLYRIADVFRNAKMTLILIKGKDDRPLSDGWVSWGMRIWTFPEALLSENFIVQVGLSNLLIKDMTLNQVANHAYGSNNEKQRMLVQLYSNKGKDFSKAPERIEMLCEAIWIRHSGPDSSITHPPNALTAYPGEKVYALMGFFLDRIRPISTESEDEAFKRLLSENGWDFDTYPGIAYKSGGARKLGVRDKKEVSAKESYILPQHIPEARFDYNGSGRRTCEAGTRVGILEKIYGWLGLDGYRDDNVSSFRAEPETNVLWLKGLAGSGKSTITQTTAEKCEAKRILGATFFCSRYTKGCSDYLNIIPTICYILCRLDEDFKRKVSEIYENDMDLQRVEADRQLEKLILEPLKAARRFPPCVIIIDALDECSDSNTRSKILTALDKYIAELKPLKFLITSRPDHDINVVFKTLSLGDNTEKLNLNNVDFSLTDRDLRIVLIKGLTGVRQEYDLPISWPTEKDISNLVVQAQHLFIFVSTAINFVRDSSASDPVDRLDLLLKSRMITSKSSPYTYLDNLYREVFRTAFSEVEEELKNKLQMILGILVLGREQFSISKLADFMGLRPWTVRSTLLKLHALVIVPENEHESIRLIHSSIHDFLTDPNRCTDSRFVVNEAVGNSTIARYCFQTLMRFAESEELHAFLQSPTRQKLISLKKSIEENEHSVIRYSYTCWCMHIVYSDLNESMIKEFKKLISNPRKFLLTQHSEEATNTLLSLVKNLPPSSSSDLPLLLYQSALFLYSEKWPESQRIKNFHLWDVLEFLQFKYGNINGLFGSNMKTIKLEVTIIFLKNFIPKEDFPELNGIISRLKKAAEKMHNEILQQTILEDRKLYWDVLELMHKFYQQLSYGVYSINDLDGGDYARELSKNLITWLHSIAAFNEIFQYILSNDGYNLDDFFAQQFRKASEADSGVQVDALHAILMIIFHEQELSSEEVLRSLQSLFPRQSENIYTRLCFFLIHPNRTLVQIRSIYPSVFSTFFDKSKRLNGRISIDPIVEHSNIAMCCMKKLLQFVSTQEMQSYLMDPSLSKQSTLRHELDNKNDAALNYAYHNWIFHIDKSNGQLDELALQHLSKLIAHRYALYILLKNNAKAKSVFLDLSNKLSRQPSPPRDIMISLYSAAIYLCEHHWPGSLETFGMHVETMKEARESMKKARETLKTLFSYKDGLYDLDSNFPFLRIALFRFADIPQDVPGLERNSREVKVRASAVHELIMQQAIPEDDRDRLALRDCMSTLYEELKSSYKTYNESQKEYYKIREDDNISDEDSNETEKKSYKTKKSDNEADTRALRTAISSWINVFNNFRTKVHDILGISDNIKPSEPSSAVVVGSSVLNGRQNIRHNMRVARSRQ